MTAVQIAFQRGYITASERDRTFAVMHQLGLALWHDACSNIPMLLRVSNLADCLVDMHLPSLP